MPEDKRTLVTLPSGTIDIVHTKAIGALLQYNCSCQDALPFCKGMCCGMRTVYNTEISEEEVASGKYSTFELPSHPDKVFLAYDPADRKCVYQNKEDGLCTIHNDKPGNCSNWHCSPGGVGEGITIRAFGWMMLPVQGVLDQAAQGLVDKKK